MIIIKKQKHCTLTGSVTTETKVSLTTLGAVLTGTILAIVIAIAFL